MAPDDKSRLGESHRQSGSRSAQSEAAKKADRNVATNGTTSGGAAGTLDNKKAPSEG